MADMAYERRIEPRAAGWRSFAWANGVFDTARRSYTEAVEGTICTPHHLVMVTLRGGAQHQEVTASCGHRYVGSDRPGAVSFVPAHCERRLRLRAVESEWASVSLNPTILQDEAFEYAGARSLEAATFTNGQDPFLAGLVGEFARIDATEGGLDIGYCDAMSWSLAHYLSCRYGGLGPERRSATWRLPPWRIRKIAEYVEARLEKEIRVADLAKIVGVSPGYLHRAFRATTGQTPLAFINERRVRRAMRILETESVSLAEIALRVGFANPSHLTRTFRAVAGLNPSQYRAANGNALSAPLGIDRHG
jgi:AraC family transcriptional regulator